MFRIRSAQMEQLGEENRARFVTLMENYVAEDFPEYAESLSRPQLRAWVEAAVTKAEKHGVTTEPECAQLVLLFLPLGLDADERLPWARDTLNNPELVAVGKVRKLAELAREHGEEIDDVVVYDFME